MIKVLQYKKCDQSIDVQSIPSIEMKKKSDLDTNNVI